LNLFSAAATLHLALDELARVGDAAVGYD